MKKGYNISEIYQGGFSSLNPKDSDNFTGAYVPASELGAPTKPDTANQIQQVHQLLNQGMVPIEVGALRPDVFDQIPKQHFKEIRRMSELAGGKLSVHAPIIEPSGMAEQGWSESNRELAERQLIDVVKKTSELDESGGMPITIHSSGIPGTEYKIVDGKKEIDKMVVVNRETGKMAPIEEETKYYPSLKLRYNPVTQKTEGAKILSHEKELEALNDTEWDNSLSQITFYKEGADKILSENEPLIADLMKDLKEGIADPNNLVPTQQKVWNLMQNAETYLEHVHQNLNGMFHKAYKYGTPEQKKALEKSSDEFRESLEKNRYSPTGQSLAIQKLISEMKKVPPKMYVPVEEFALEQSSKTFSNVAWESYNTLKEKSPTISIENLPHGMAFANAKDMNNLIVKSREGFVEKAKANGMSESEAKKIAERVIGMTLDVGHLNVARKQGFKDEDLAKEVAEIAKHVKHIHLTDNFGYSDTHLAPGMGNVPFKKIFDELDKAGTLEGKRKIVESGGFVQQFGTSPYVPTLEAMGSPIYSMKMAPYWSQAEGLYQGYFSGAGAMLPQMNYEMFGAGFSQLPLELGGQRGGGAGSRMSGRSME